MRPGPLGRDQTRLSRNGIGASQVQRATLEAVVEQQRDFIEITYGELRRQLDQREEQEDRERFLDPYRHRWMEATVDPWHYLFWHDAMCVSVAPGGPGGLFILLFQPDDTRWHRVGRTISRERPVRIVGQIERTFGSRGLILVDCELDHA